MWARALKLGPVPIPALLSGERATAWFDKEVTFLQLLWPIVTETKIAVAEFVYNSFEAIVEFCDTHNRNESKYGLIIMTPPSTP